MTDIIEIISAFGQDSENLNIVLLLGSISSATAPAATVDVLWEYKTRGPLTRTILAIVALDDGLALVLFGFAASAADVLTGHTETGLMMNLLTPLWEIGGSIILGAVTGVFLVLVLRYLTENDKVLTLTLAAVMLIIGASIPLKVDSILAAMALGATIANFLPRRSQSTFELVEKFSPPIYVLFFVLVGARLQITSMPVWVAALAVVYVLSRTAGKISGAWFGAKISASPATIRKYLGFCLFSQAGVAVGLSIVAGQRFGDSQLGQAVVLVVTTTTFLVQIIGPPFVWFGVKKAGEIGMNITEQDLIKTYKVRDVMDREIMSINEAMPLDDILSVFTRSERLYYPVVNGQGTLCGYITIEGVKNALAFQVHAGWLLACDVMEPVRFKTTEEIRLEEAMETMEKYDLEYMPVTADEQSDKFAGILDLRSIKRKVSAEVLTRREQTE